MKREWRCKEKKRFSFLVFVCFISTIVFFWDSRKMWIYKIYKWMVYYVSFGWWGWSFFSHISSHDIQYDDDFEQEKIFFYILFINFSPIFTVNKRNKNQYHTFVCVCGIKVDDGNNITTHCCVFIIAILVTIGNHHHHHKKWFYSDSCNNIQNFFCCMTSPTTTTLLFNTRYIGE